MSSSYEGGLGTREGGDLVRWRLEIDDGMDSFRVMGARTPVYAQTRPVEATLTLYSISKEESMAVISLLNEMRGPVGRTLPVSPIGNRFSGLEFD